MLIIVPITFAIADALKIHPMPFLIGEILFANIGGTATLIGDPPNILIGNRAPIGFMHFIYHNGGPGRYQPQAPLVGSFPGGLLGGNGTLIGASANIIVASYARKNQYPITFLAFLKVGYPIMLGTIVLATLYLILVHIL